MPTNYALGDQLESFVQAQIASGRYTTASEVVSDALRLMQERERRLAELDAAIEHGMTDIRAGRMTEIESVFDRLEAKYAGMADHREP